MSEPPQDIIPSEPLPLQAGDGPANIGWGDGSVLLAGRGFLSDPTTGVFRRLDGGIGFTRNFAERFGITSEGAELLGGLDIPGIAAAPTASNSLFVLSADDKLYYKQNGVVSAIQRVDDPVVDPSITSGDTVEKLSVTNTAIVFGESGSGTEYFWPITRGNPGETPVIDGAGNVTWQIGVAANVYTDDDSLSSNRTMTLAGYTMTFAGSTYSPQFDAAGTLSAPSVTSGLATIVNGVMSGFTSAEIGSLEFDSLTAGNAASLLNIPSGNAFAMSYDGTARITLSSINGIEIGSGATNWYLPLTRGAAGQVIKMSAAGVAIWASDDGGGGGDGSIYDNDGAIAVNRTLTLAVGGTLNFNGSTYSTSWLQDGTMNVTGVINSTDGMDITNGYLSMNSGATSYTFPQARAAASGYVITAGVGGISTWEPLPAAPNTLYSADDTLGANREVTLGGNQLQFTGSSTGFRIGSTGIIESNQIQAFNAGNDIVLSTSGAGRILLSADPTAALHAATKGYTDGLFGQLSISGQQIVGSQTNGDIEMVPNGSGRLILNGDPTLGAHAATKDYVDAVLADLTITGQIISGTQADTDITISPLGAGRLILNGDPTSAFHAATMQYVDNEITTALGSYLPLTGGTVTGITNFSAQVNFTGGVTGDNTVYSTDGTLTGARTITTSGNTFAIDNNLYLGTLTQGLHFENDISDANNSNQQIVFQDRADGEGYISMCANGSNNAFGLPTGALNSIGFYAKENGNPTPYALFTIIRDGGLVTAHANLDVLGALDVTGAVTGGAAEFNSGSHRFLSDSGDCEVVIEADTADSDEDANPKLILRQDGGGIVATFGLAGATGLPDSNVPTNWSYIDSSNGFAVIPPAEFQSAVTFDTGVTFSGSITGLDTDDVTEATNLYYTDTRARAAFSAGANINLTAGGEISVTGLDTDDVSEATNLYYTDTRARAAFSAGVGINLTAGGEISVIDHLPLAGGNVSGSTSFTGGLSMSGAFTHYGGSPSFINASTDMIFKLQGNVDDGTNSTVPMLRVTQGSLETQKFELGLNSTDGTFIGTIPSDAAFIRATAGGIQFMNEIIGNAGISTTGATSFDNPTHLFTTSAGGDCQVIIEADPLNNNEQANPQLLLRQDGGAVTLAIGIHSNVGDPPYPTIPSNVGYIDIDEGLYVINDLHVLQEITSQTFIKAENYIETESYIALWNNDLPQISLQDNEGTNNGILRMTNDAIGNDVFLIKNGQGQADMVFNTTNGGDFRFVQQSNDAGDTGLLKTTLFLSHSNIGTGTGLTAPVMEVGFDTANVTQIRIESAADSQLRFRHGGSTQAVLLCNETGVLEIDADLGTRFEIGGTERVYLNATGLGIGESDPVNLLHITDTAVNPNNYNNDCKIIIEHAGEANIGFYGSDGQSETQGLIWGRDTDSFRAAFDYQHSTNSFRFYINNGERIRMYDNYFETITDYAALIGGNGYFGPGVSEGISSQTTNTDVQTRFVFTTDTCWIQAGKHQSDTNANLNLTRYFGGTLATILLHATETRTRELIPDTSLAYDLGNSTNLWREIFCTNQTINTSDERLKRDIAEIPVGLDFVCELGEHAKMFKWKDSEVEINNYNSNVEDGEPAKTTHTKTLTHSRYHWSFMAQRVKMIMQKYGVDSGFLIDPSVVGESGYMGLRMGEAVPAITRAIWQLRTMHDNAVLQIEANTAALVALNAAEVATAIQSMDILQNSVDLLTTENDLKNERISALETEDFPGKIAKLREDVDAAAEITEIASAQQARNTTDITAANAEIAGANAKIAAAEAKLELAESKIAEQATTIENLTTEVDTSKATVSTQQSLIVAMEARLAALEAFVEGLAEPSE